MRYAWVVAMGKDGKVSRKHDFSCREVYEELAGCGRSPLYLRWFWGVGMGEDGCQAWGATMEYLDVGSPSKSR